jgi:hypothetical protein
MAEVRLQIPDELVQRFQDKLGSNVKVTDIAKDALTLFNWAVDERAKGRLVLSSDEEGEKVVRLAMPLLEKAAPPSTSQQAQTAQQTQTAATPPVEAAANRR